MMYLQSAFFKAAGYALILNIIQAALLWLIVYALNKFINRSPQQRFTTAFTAQVFCALLFLFTLGYFLRYNETLYNAAILPLARLKNFSDTRLMPLLAQLYFLAAGFQLIKYITDIIAARRFGSEIIHPFAEGWQQFIHAKATELNIKRKVQLQISSAVQTPAVTGFLKPVIVMPLSAVNNLSSFEMEAVLLHELAHIQRNDYLLYLIQSAIQKILWFNPFVLLLSKIIETERENCCDDFVLRGNYNKLQYAEALYKLAVNKATVNAAVHFAGKKDMQLLTRIQRIMLNNKQVAYTPASIFCISLFVGAFSIFALMFVSLPVNKSSAGQLKRIVKKEKARLPLIPTAPGTRETIAIKIQPENIHHEPKSVVAVNKESKPSPSILSKPRVKENTVVTNTLQPLTFSVNPVVLNNVVNANNTTVNLTEAQYQKIISYNTFKNVESMLAVSGDSCISVKESNITRDSYQKQITITTISKNGDKHIYTVIIEMYQ